MMTRSILPPITFFHSSRRGILLILAVILLLLLLGPPVSPVDRSSPRLLDNKGRPSHKYQHVEAPGNTRGGGAGVAKDDSLSVHHQVGAQQRLRQGLSGSGGTGNTGHGGSSEDWSWKWVKDTASKKVGQKLKWGESTTRNNRGRLDTGARARAPQDSPAVANNGGGDYVVPAQRYWEDEFGDEEEEDEEEEEVQVDQEYDPEMQALLAYRQHLEKEHSPHEYKKHSPTLTFSKIYVLSLPRRADRRLRMSKIAKALGLRFVYVDATSKDSPLVGWIAERVKEVRDRKREILAKGFDVPPASVGGLGVDSMWLQSNESERFTFPDMRHLDQRWTASSHVDLKKNKDVAPTSTGLMDAVEAQSNTSDATRRPQETPEAIDWVSFLHSTPVLHKLEPATKGRGARGGGGQETMDAFVTKLLHDPNEPLPARQVNAGVIATYYSQTKIWRKMLKEGDESALILEDDVDIEWDLERMWPNVERALPKDWEIVFLGHCWGKELTKPQYVHPQLHEATEPRCLHGYALSRRGAERLLRLFSDPWRAYQTPIDTFIPYLTRSATLAAEKKAKEQKNERKKQKSNNSQAEKGEADDHLRAFSLEPAMIIQSKDFSSDIQDGTGSVWKGLLADSTWDRIQRDEGAKVKQLTWSDVKGDPAIRVRPWGDGSIAGPRRATSPGH